jgi:alanine racemase
MLTWVEVSRSALLNNLAQFRKLAGTALVAPVVKANAYGHGLVLTARILAAGGADRLCINAAYEAELLRQAGIELPLLQLGYLSPAEAGQVAALDVAPVVYDPDVVRALAAAGRAAGRTLRVHLKVETGNNRQGLPLAQAVELARLIRSLPGIELEGLSSHYADIEDTTDHTYAKSQLARFNEAFAALTAAGVPPRIRNFSNSAAAILWNETHFELLRVGIATYGMWPSRETLVTAKALGRDKTDLAPALTWKTVVAQVKEVPPGDTVGYGRSFQTTRATRLAVLPVGYYDGYDRKLGGSGRVLVRGRIAPVLGRVCMNMIMVDVTDIPGVRAGEEVVLLGRSGQQEVSAERLAGWIGTINYEVTTRINDRIPRIVVE